MGLAEGLLLGHGQAMLIQLWVQVSQEDTGFHCYLLLLLVHLEESAQAGKRPQLGPCFPATPLWDVSTAISVHGQPEVLFSLEGEQRAQGCRDVAGVGGWEWGRGFVLKWSLSM